MLRSWERPYNLQVPQLWLDTHTLKIEKNLLPLLPQLLQLAHPPKQTQEQRLMKMELQSPQLHRPMKFPQSQPSHHQLQALLKQLLIQSPLKEQQELMASTISRMPKPKWTILMIEPR